MNARAIRNALLAVLGAVLLVGPTPALAWGELGHRVVADLALARLTPEAKAQVQALIAEAPVSGEPSCPVASLSDAAVFVDCVEGLRRFNDLRRLRSEAQPLCPAEARGDPCKDGECLTAALKRAIATLSDRTQPPAARLYALEQVAWFMAELHQPFSMIDNRDDAGREVRIVLPGSSDRRLNLHDFWHDHVLSLAVGSEALGYRWLQPVALAGQRWDEGGVDAWAGETAGLARTLYAGLPEPPQCGRNPKAPEVFDRGRVMAAVPIARGQLARAGVRLAAVLNGALR